MGSLAGVPLAAVELVGVEPSGHEVPALVPEGVPGRQRLGAARLLRVEWLLDAVAGGRILQAERRIRGGVDAAHQNTVDEQEEQHRHDEDADGGGRRDREVPPPDESCRDPPHQFAQQPPHRDDRGAHEQTQTARADVAGGGGALRPHQRGELTLPCRGVREHHEAHDHARHRHDDAQAGGPRFRQRPPRPVPQEVATHQPADRRSHRVTDRGVDAADQPLEQPVAGQQRRRQRPAEEQRRERDAGEVEPKETPGPVESGTVEECRINQPREFPRPPVNPLQCPRFDHSSPEQCRQSSLERRAQLGQRDRELALDLDGIGALVDHTDAHPREITGRAHTGEASFLGARDRDEHAARRLGEQGDERIGVVGKQDAAARLAGQRGLDDGLRETTFGQVVRRGRPVRRGTPRGGCRRATAPGRGRPSAARRRGGRARPATRWTRRTRRGCRRAGSASRPVPVRDRWGCDGARRR